MHHVCLTLLLMIIEVFAEKHLSVHAEPSRHCDDLLVGNVSCPALCECCLRNARFDDASLAIKCNQPDKLEPNFVDHLTTLLQSLKATEIALKLFDLRTTPLGSIPDEICTITSLEELHLTQLRLTSVSASCIRQLTQLRVLNLTHNAIASLPTDLIYGLTNLVVLQISHNWLVDVPPEVFSLAQNVTKMELIDFSNNGLTSIDIWPLYFISDALVINIINNNISIFTNRLHYKFKCDTTQTKRSGAKIALDGNNVQHLMDMVTGYGFTGVHDFELYCMFLSAIFDISFLRNPLICDCIDYGLYKAMTFAPHKSNGIDSLYCAQPPALNGQKLLKATEHMDQFVCNLQDYCPAKCECFEQPSSSSVVVLCNEKGLDELASALPALPQLNYYYYVNYSGNQIGTVQSSEYFGKSKTIRLDHNHIHSIDPEAFTSMANVTELHLNNNLLTTLPPQVANLKWPNLVAIHLYDNPWSCDCHSLWIKHWLASLGTAVVVNLNAITCSTDDVRNGRSVTVVSDADFVCGHIMSTTEILWFVVPTVAASVIAVVGTTVVTLYAKRKWLYKRFKLHPFDVDECNGEHMTHDVFLSGADEDTDAIMVLYSQLQQLGYRVCYHKIDFVPGVPTIENIDSAITHSKRTLCYVTRSFVQSDWCKWEFENALNRDLTNKRHRLIAIVDDVNYTDVTYSSIRQYMQTYTYIERHADDFMHTLMYSLAQRKLGGQQQNQHSQQDGLQQQHEESQQQQEVMLADHHELACSDDDVPLLENV